MKYHDGRPPGLIITPATHPDRFTDQERVMFDAGGHLNDFGSFSGPEWCTKPSAPKADFGHCQQHARNLLDKGPEETNWQLGWNGKIR